MNLWSCCVYIKVCRTFPLKSYFSDFSDLLYVRLYNSNTLISVAALSKA
jgi:hypothetical protein